MSAARSLYERTRMAFDASWCHLTPKDPASAPTQIETGTECHSRGREIQITNYREDSSSLHTLSAENAQVTFGADCPHATEEWLQEWRRENPKLICARCWLERRGRLPLKEPAKPPLKSRGTVAAGAARNHAGVRPTGGRRA